VILVDSNLLIYAKVQGFPQHEAALAWLNSRLRGAAPVALPWPSVLSFLRLVTNRRIFHRPMPFADAWMQVEEWLDCTPVWIPAPGTGHRDVMAKLLKSCEGNANLIPDAHLAALAIEHGLTLCTADGDFARFKDLSWQNPLAE
jgi:hypothetical protein